MEPPPTRLLHSGNKLFKRLLVDIFLHRLFFFLLLFIWVCKKESSERVAEINEFKRNLVAHPFSTTGRLGGQDLFI